MNIKQLMKQAQQMQDQMQQKLATIKVEGSAGGGMVKAEMSGSKELLSVARRFRRFIARLSMLTGQLPLHH